MYKQKYLKKFYVDISKDRSFIAVFLLLVKLIAFFTTRNILWIVYLIFNPNNVQIKIFGKKFILPTKKIGFDWSESTITKQLVLSRIREVESTKILSRIIKPGNIIIEIGANMGYFVMLETQVMKHQGKIIAIEPEKKNLHYLKKNICINDLQKMVEVHELAISDRDGFIDLNISKEANCHSIFSPENKKIKKSVRTRTQTLDSFLRKNDYKADLIRMDIEGAECMAVDGMKKTFKKNKILHLFIEIHPHLFNETPNPIIKMLRTLKECGFETTYVISYDKYYRRLLHMHKVENISITQLINDRRVKNGLIGFQVFFEKR